MNTTPFFQDKNPGQITQLLHNFESAHKEDLQAILQVMVKITCRTFEQIKPHLDAMLEHLVEPKERPFDETATPSERARAFREWADSHERNTPLLSDCAVISTPVVQLS